MGIIIVASLACATTSSYARDCTASERETADKVLWLNKRDKDAAVSKHLPWGLPESTVATGPEELLIQRDYVNNYDDELLIPIWTAHRLDAKGLEKVSRVDCFRRDPRIGKPAASLPSDYSEPVFDQGHITPSGDMTKALNPVLNSFVMSNMAPQYCQFNRGVWQILESIVRLWAADFSTVYVISGSVFDWDGDGARDGTASIPRMKSNNGKARVAVPSHFYKIIFLQDAEGDFYSLSILLPHDQTDLDGDDAVNYLNEHVVPIHTIEKLSGLRFSFPEVNEAGSLWEYSGTPARSTVSAQCRATAGHGFH